MTAYFRRSVPFKGKTRYGNDFPPPKWHIAEVRGDLVIIALCGYEALLTVAKKPDVRVEGDPKPRDICIKCTRKLEKETS